MTRPVRLRIGHAPSAGDVLRGAAHALAAALASLGFDAFVAGALPASTDGDASTLELGDGPRERRGAVALDGPGTLLERALRAIPLGFDALPLLVEGDSKVVRLWTDRVVVSRLKPTVYSFTMNRYGEAPGTHAVRARFAAAIFREMAALPPREGIELRSAFLAELPSPDGPLLVQRRVETCNLEVRIKRFHVGSPLHRYVGTERHPTTPSCGPLRRWSRLDRPVVCFDWRNPLRDDDGERLADEPLSDDYAAIWMRDVPHARELARQTFLWLEERFARADVLLVDMCLFIDREGRTIHGEISPDCMRIRLAPRGAAPSSGPFIPPAPEALSAADKDVWRQGRSPAELLGWYETIERRLFS